jgi:hypothetical protein
MSRRQQVLTRRDKCLAVAIKDGRTLVCWKSPGHVESKHSDRREHYDPSAEERWADD